jgi:hypothetical protein
MFIEAAHVIILFHTTTMISCRLGSYTERYELPAVDKKVAVETSKRLISWTLIRRLIVKIEASCRRARGKADR